jgi:hypothetical protein
MDRFLSALSRAGFEPLRGVEIIGGARLPKDPEVVTRVSGESMLLVRSLGLKARRAVPMARHLFFARLHHRPAARPILGIATRRDPLATAASVEMPGHPGASPHHRSKPARSSLKS